MSYVLDYSPLSLAMENARSVILSLGASVEPLLRLVDGLLDQHRLLLSLCRNLVFWFKGLEFGMW